MHPTGMLSCSLKISQCTFQLGITNSRIRDRIPVSREFLTNMQIHTVKGFSQLPEDVSKDPRLTKLVTCIMLCFPLFW